MTRDTISNLVESTAQFLEAVTVAPKARTSRAIAGSIEKDLSKALKAQGRAFVKRFASLQGKFQESISDDDWIGIWDDTAQVTERLFIRPIRRAVQLSLLAAAEELI